MQNFPTPLASNLSAPFKSLQQGLRIRPEILSKVGVEQGTDILLSEDANNKQMMTLPNGTSSFHADNGIGKHLPTSPENSINVMIEQQLIGTNEKGNIFLTSDDHSLAKYIAQQHKPDGRYVNVRPLFRIVEDIIYRATLTAEDSSSLGIQLQKQSLDDKLDLNILNEFPDSALIIERISSEIACNLLKCSDAHNTTLSMLNSLPHFSWEAKLVLSLASFGLTYGDFWLLAQIYSTNPLAKSMAIIKGLPMVMEHAETYKSHFEATNNLIKAMLETTRCIVEFGELPTMYISNEDPEVKAALAHIPIAVYWVIRSSIAVATQITTLSSRGFEYVQATAESWEISNGAHKLKVINEYLRNTLINLYRLIDEKKEIDHYNTIIKVVYHTMHVDNLSVLKILINFNYEEPPLFDGSTKNRVHLDMLRRRNVLLLMSKLDISQEEVYNLEQIYITTKKQAYEIVWIPILDHSKSWTDAMQAQFENKRAMMPWYSIHEPTIIQNAAIKFFKDDWHFKGSPILVALDTQGKVVCPNAIHMMRIWKTHAFPFTRTREELLWEQEDWNLELLVDDIDQSITEWVKEGKYIFLYGGDNIEWIRKFTKEANLIARALQVPLEMVYVGTSHHKEAVQKLCATIAYEKLSHCWKDSSQIWYFWTRIESMIQSKIQLEKMNDHGDVILQEIQRLHSHDKAHAGWALLAKGSRIVVDGHGKLTLIALQEFTKWQERAMRVGFDVAYEAYYTELRKKEYPCQRIEFPSTAKLPSNLLCPDCRHHMKKYSTFICCHEDVNAEGQLVPYHYYDEM